METGYYIFLSFIGDNYRRKKETCLSDKYYYLHVFARRRNADTEFF